MKPPQLTLPNPALAQTNAPFKKPTDMKWTDPNFSPVRTVLLLLQLSLTYLSFILGREEGK